MRLYELEIEGDWLKQVISYGVDLSQALYRAE